MKKQIITISRQFGSGGHSVGKAVSEALGIPFYDQEIVESICEESDMGIRPEDLEDHVAPAKRKFLYNFLGHDYRGMSLPDYLWAAQVKVIEEVAESGPCVIVGRCADYVLRDHEDALHVFVHAPLDKREIRVLERYGETDEDITRRVTDKDQKRAAHYEYYTGRKWGFAENYHLSLDSSLIGIDDCVDIILTTLKKSGDEVNF